MEWSLLQWRQGRIRQQALQNGPIKTSSNLQTHPRCSTVPVDAQPVFAPTPSLPSHFSADLCESQDGVLGLLGGGAAAPFAPRGDTNASQGI